MQVLPAQSSVSRNNFQVESDKLLNLSHSEAQPTPRPRVICENQPYFLHQHFGEMMYFSLGAILRFDVVNHPNSDDI